jgi:hypothetical protein
MKTNRDQHRHSLITNEQRKQNCKVLLQLTTNETFREKELLSYFSTKRELLKDFFVSVGDGTLDARRRLNIPSSLTGLGHLCG